MIIQSFGNSTAMVDTATKMKTKEIFKYIKAGIVQNHTCDKIKMFPPSKRKSDGKLYCKQMKKKNKTTKKII